jgi:hypothetical protein
LWAAVRATERPLTSEMITFRRKEQMKRLRKLFCRSRFSEATSLGLPKGVA